MTSNQPGKGMSWGEMLGLGLLSAVVGLLYFSGRSNSFDGEMVPKGTPLPLMMAEGWLNSAGPVSREQLKNKVVVVDCWATWCPPCRAAMPELAELYAAYKPMGVEFVGLTPEDSRDLQTVERFIESVEGFDWPVGYGTGPMLDLLGIGGLPTVIVFGADGVAVWSGYQLDGIKSVLDQELARVSAK